MRATETSPASPLQTTTTITGNDIPDDVWRLIVEQVSRITDVLPYMGLHRIFYNYVLGRKYDEVKWFFLSKSFLKQLERLQEPLIAQHVHVLHIRAWFIEYLLRRDALFHPPSVLSRVNGVLKAPFISIWSKMHGNYHDRLRPQWMLQHQHRQTSHDTSCKRVIKSMIKAVEGMNNVVQFNFEWRDLPLTLDTRIFLTSTRTSFDKSLRKLSLRAQLSNFKELLAITNFDNIEELDFHFDYRIGELSKNRKSGKDTAVNQQDAPDPEIQESLNTIIPFIKHRHSSLKSLFISSTSYMDLSSFFNALPSDLTSLRRFGLRISYDEYTLSDPSAILHVLVSRPFFLRHISLLANLEQRHLGGDDDSSNSNITSSRDNNLRLRRLQWNRVNDLLLSRPKCLSNLESLEIPFVSLSKTIPLLRRSCDTLTRLCLVDYYLTRDDVMEIIGLFNHRPLEVQHLHLEVMVLDFSLIQTLATRLPDLLSLVLIYNSSNSEDSFDGYKSDAALLNWKLYEFEAYQRRFQPHDPDSRAVSGSNLEEMLMRAMLRLVPSLHFQFTRPQVFLAVVPPRNQTIKNHLHSDLRALPGISLDKYGDDIDIDDTLCLVSIWFTVGVFVEGRSAFQRPRSTIDDFFPLGTPDQSPPPSDAFGA